MLRTWKASGTNPFNCPRFGLKLSRLGFTDHHDVMPRYVEGPRQDTINGEKGGITQTQIFSNRE